MIMKYGECMNNDSWGFGYDEGLSYGEEAQIASWVEEQVYYDNITSQIDKGIWTQKNGEQINITEMTTSHIQNCINMLNRKLEKNAYNEFEELWVHRFKKELAFRNYIKNIMSGVLD